MRVTIRDEKVLRAVEPRELIAYLRSHGFTEHAGAGTATGIWRRGAGNDEVEVLVPREPTYRDYAARVLDALRALEAVEERSQLDILRDIRASTADVVRIPATRADTRDGSISINDGFAFYANARELLMAAACAAIEPKSYYATRRPSQATRYLDQARFGQTEHSSYVITIVSPVPPRLSAESLGDSVVEEPYERQVIVTLMRAVAGARAAAERAAVTENLDHFREAVAVGVSANLCAALVGLSRGCDQDLEVSVAWSPTRPGPPEAPSRVRLPIGSMPIFEEAARVFRATSPEPEFELRGYVSHLDRAEMAAEGTVTIRGFVEGRPRAVELRLSEPHYGLAVRAHADRLPVYVVGELRKRGPSFVLESPRLFTIESPGD
jgi:hypothetical protein